MCFAFSCDARVAHLVLGAMGDAVSPDGGAVPNDVSASEVSVSVHAPRALLFRSRAPTDGDAASHLVIIRPGAGCWRSS